MPPTTSTAPRITCSESSQAVQKVSRLLALSLLLLLLALPGFGEDLGLQTWRVALFLVS